MELDILKNLIKKKRKIVVLGESGSGKSEFAINLALKLKEEITEKEIHFFDMDQTKPLFRSRDVKNIFNKNNIMFHSPQQFLESNLASKTLNY